VVLYYPEKTPGLAGGLAQFDSSIVNTGRIFVLGLWNGVGRRQRLNMRTVMVEKRGHWNGIAKKRTKCVVLIYKKASIRPTALSGSYRKPPALPEVTHYPEKTPGFAGGLAQFDSSVDK